MPLDAVPPRAPRSADADTLRRIGTLAARSWQCKLYAPARDAAGLRPEDLARADRAYRAGIAAPGMAVVTGFALLRSRGETGGLTLHACWWEGALLHRAALDLSSADGPPHWAAMAGLVGEVDEILLMAREAAAWRRSVLDAEQPSVDAYLAECCA